MAETKEGLKVVAVVNNFEQYNRCIKENTNVNQYELCVFDNTNENIGVSERYNSFIDKLDENSDFWVAFLHQDFIFNEDPLEKLKNLSKESLYGVVGVTHPLVYLQFKPKFTFKIWRRSTIGLVKQGEGDGFVGIELLTPKKVNTVDCCCIMVHSSLLVNKGLRFDENLKFHMYAEDFCIGAKKNGIDSYVVQFDCRHLSRGYCNEEFHKCAQYVRDKYKILRIHSTCCK